MPYKTLPKLTPHSVEAYHTGAGTADPVFQKANKGPLAYLNGTHLQLDVGQGNAYPFSLVASTTDLNYARWELTSISIGWGSGKFVNNGPEGLQLKDEEFGGWVLCEWFHVLSDEVQNAPQLFVANSGFDGNKMAGGPKDLPASCANVLLFPEFV